VILTSLHDETLALEAVRAGAQDYLPKAQLAGHTLARAMRYAMERAQAAERMRRLNDEPAQRSSERTAELQAAYKELEAFAYSIAHDLRAPLWAIHGFTAIVLRKSAPSSTPTPRLPAACAARGHPYGAVDRWAPGLLALHSGTAYETAGGAR
jgi:signal transduction histidine kinase